ncbi:MAG: MBL fold metallo-hydrolase [Desulfonauticus sp.]|nr:MBL fold metallo-hydrolase [Desulfonauticus sp.]
MLKVKIFTLGPLGTNCYVLFSDQKAVVIDPGGDPEEVISFLEDNGLSVENIFNTHLHFDHTYGNAKLSQHTGASILASEKDRFLLDSELGRGGFMDFPEVEPFGFQRLEPGTLQVLGVECQVLETPGHTPGSLSFYFPEQKIVFVGDLLFFRSVGRTDFPGGNLETLKNAVKEKIFTLPGETIVYPGHGEETLVKEEKLHNPFFVQYNYLS